MGAAEPGKPSTVNTTLNASALLVPARDPFWEIRRSNIPEHNTYMHLRLSSRSRSPRRWQHLGISITFSLPRSDMSKLLLKTNSSKGQGNRRTGPTFGGGGGMFHWCGRRVEGRDSCKNKCRIKNQYVPLMIWRLPTAVDKLLGTQGTTRMKRCDTGGEAQHHP